MTELGVSLDHVFRGHADGRAEDGGPGHVPEPEADPVVHPGDRHVIDLASGVRWERLTSHQQEAVDFLHVVYEVGGSSSPDDKLMRHAGREYGYVISGTLNVQIGFTERELGPGDSIAFDSTQPHRLWNDGRGTRARDLVRRGPNGLSQRRPQIPRASSSSSRSTSTSP